MSTIEPGRIACDAYYGQRGLVNDTTHIWPILTDRERTLFVKLEEAVRAPLQEEIHALKMAAAGGEDVPGAANLVTVDDVVRYRVEAAEEIERLRVKLNAAQSSLSGAVRDANALRQELSTRQSTIKRMRQDVQALGTATPPGYLQEYGDAYRFAWNGLNHIDAASAGIRSILRSVGSRLIESWPAVDEDGEPRLQPHGLDLDPRNPAHDYAIQKWGADWVMNEWGHLQWFVHLMCESREPISFKDARAYCMEAYSTVREHLSENDGAAPQADAAGGKPGEGE